MKYEYDVFLSYSSRDRNRVQKLAEKLAEKGFKIWLDEWHIKVGDKIIRKISDGLEQSRYLAIWLSQHSISSKWVENEWQAKYWEEVESTNVVLLPLLGEDCIVPILLRGRHYADFSGSFDYGFNELLKAIGESSSPTLELCRENLLNGVDPNQSAEILARIATRNSDEYALTIL